MGLGFAVDGIAQSRPTAPAERPADQPRPTPRDTFRSPQGVFESRHIVGMRVKDSLGKDLGEIDQLLIDSKDGKVTHAVVGLGGMLGIGERHVVVPWSDVKISADPSSRADRPVINIDPAALARAPRYEKRAAAAGRDSSPPSASPRSDPPAATRDQPTGTTGRPAPAR
jgi:sporulation protein YlmC with PRC-barrel domain